MVGVRVTHEAISVPSVNIATYSAIRVMRICESLTEGSRDTTTIVLTIGDTYNRASPLCEQCAHDRGLWSVCDTTRPLTRSAVVHCERQGGLVVAQAPQRLLTSTTKSGVIGDRA
jgi:hypothetical protein